MFKTVRAPHGVGDPVAELEYTILPQTDDRSPSVSSGEDEPTSAGYHQHRHQQQRPHHQHQHNCQHHRGLRSAAVDGDVSASTRRTVIVIIAMLVLGCGVVAAAVLVPILLAARLVSVPASARLQTFAVAASGVIHSARGDYVQLLPVRHAPPGTVIEFEPLLERPRQPPPANPRRKRRSASVRGGGGRPRRPGGWPRWPRRPRSWRTTVGVSHRFRTGSSAGFRSLDFRIRQ